MTSLPFRLSYAFDKRTRRVTYGTTRISKCPEIPSCIPINESTNLDKRTALAKSFYEITSKNEHYIIYKTARSGATTSLIAESATRKEPIVVIEPTHRIAKEIEKGIWKYTENHLARVVRVLPNRECIKIKEKIKNFPDLKKLPTIPLPEECGEGCIYFKECRNMDLIKIENPDVIVLTQHKCAALVLSEKFSSISAAMIEKIRGNPINVLFDECHRLQFDKKESVLLRVVSKKEGILTSNFDKYDLINEYRNIMKVITRFDEIVHLESVITALNEVIDDVKTFKPFHKRLSQVVEFRKDTGSGVEKNEILEISVFKEIVQLTENISDFELNMSDVLQIYKMLAVVTAPRVAINAVKVNGSYYINMTAMDSTHIDAISTFLMSMQEEKRVILTSATIGSFEYGKLFMNHVKPHSLLWGKGGDPLNTNSKMLIMSDKFTVMQEGKNSILGRKEILNNVITILKRFPDAKIIAMNGKTANVIKTELKSRGVYTHKDAIDYYNSDRSIGVENEYRTLIIVGLAYKPSSAFDHMTDSPEESFKMWIESVHADTWQAISRVKDPNGVIPSVVFALGVKYDDCVNVATWGKNRQIEVTEGKGKLIPQVTFDSNEKNRITFPKFKPCKNITDMLMEAIHHMSPK